MPNDLWSTQCRQGALSHLKFQRLPLRVVNQQQESRVGVGERVPQSRDGMADKRNEASGPAREPGQVELPTKPSSVARGTLSAARRLECEDAAVLRQAVPESPGAGASMVVRAISCSSARLRQPLTITLRDVWPTGSHHKRSFDGPQVLGANRCAGRGPFPRATNRCRANVPEVLGPAPANRCA